MDGEETMQVKFRNIDGNHYVIDPTTVKTGDKRMLSVNSNGTTHIIMITDPSMQDADTVFGEEVKTRISEMMNGVDRRNLDIKNKEIGIGGLQITFIDYVQYQINGKAYEVADRAQRIFVCSAVCQEEEMIIYLPDSAVHCFTDVRLEMKYKRAPYIIQEIVKGAWGKTSIIQKDTGFELVKFEKILGYSDGMVSYDVELKGHRYTIPITQEMTGKTLLIKKVQGVPLVFNTNDLTLIEVKEI